MSDDQKPQAANLLRLKCSASDRRHPGCSDSEFFCEAVSIQLRRVWAAASRQDGCHSLRPQPRHPRLRLDSRLQSDPGMRDRVV